MIMIEFDIVNVSSEFNCIFSLDIFSASHECKQLLLYQSIQLSNL